MMMRHAMAGHAPQNIPPRRIQVGTDMPALTFPITPLGMITGHVTLSTSDPADGIQIIVYGRQFENGHARWQQVGLARTRSDGSFRIADLDPGRYMVSTQASLDRPPSGGNDRAPVWGYPAMYYPGVTDVSAAGMLTLAAGQQAEADLTLVRQQFFSVTALLHSPSDTPGNALVPAASASSAAKAKQRLVSPTKSQSVKSPVSKPPLPATAQQLQAIHQFTEELTQVTGGVSLYNESLGTTSDLYQYDRVKGREALQPAPARPWELGGGH